MITAAYAHVLLTQWGAWSTTEGVIPKRMQMARARWQDEVPDEWPEEPDHNHLISGDDETMGLVDLVVAGMRKTDLRFYVVLIDVYRNNHTYSRGVEAEAVECFERWYNLKTAGQRIAASA